MSPAGPEDKAREEIERLLTAAGWHFCDCDSHGISKSCAIREFPLKQGQGHADYLLYLHRKTGVGPQTLFACSAFGVVAR